MIWSFLLGAAVLSAPVPAIPAAYHGEWSADLAACGGENTNGVMIGERSITFYEARGTVIDAPQDARTGSMRVRFNGEGRTWEEVVRFEPKGPDRLELAALGRAEIYHRCPDASH